MNVAQRALTPLRTSSRATVTRDSDGLCGNIGWRSNKQHLRPKIETMPATVILCHPYHRKKVAILFSEQSIYEPTCTTYEMRQLNRSGPPADGGRPFSCRLNTAPTDQFRLMPFNGANCLICRTFWALYGNQTINTNGSAHCGRRPSFRSLPITPAAQNYVLHKGPCVVPVHVVVVHECSAAALYYTCPLPGVVPSPVIIYLQTSADIYATNEPSSCTPYWLDAATSNTGVPRLPAGLLLAFAGGTYRSVAHHYYRFRQSLLHARLVSAVARREE